MGELGRAARGAGIKPGPPDLKGDTMKCEAPTHRRFSTGRDMRVIALLASALTLGSPAAGVEPSFSNGKDLLALCQDNQDACWHYIMGVADTHTVLSAKDPLVKQFCFPGQTPIDQFQSVTVKWLKDHPDRQQFSAASLVLGALHDAFPCGAKK